MMPQSAQDKRLERALFRLLDRYSCNHRWILEHRKDLEPYAGRYVAVDKGRVLASSRSLRALYRRFEKRRYVAFDYIDPPGPGLVRILALGAH
jgi:hypothetical protein